MPSKKSVADILADYAEALMAERRPDIAKDVATLSPQEQDALRPLLAAVRNLKAAYQDVPSPRSEFVQRLATYGPQVVPQEGTASPTTEPAPSRSTSDSATDRLTSDRLFALIRRAVEASRRDPSTWAPLRVMYDPGHRLAFGTRLTESKTRRSIRVWFELDFAGREVPLVSTIAFYKHKEDHEWNDELFRKLDGHVPAPGGIAKERLKWRSNVGIRLTMPADAIEELGRQSQEALVVETLSKFFSACCAAIERGLQNLT